jgi:2-succinyl-5-enolpyruvyl-6-hydroxy-3-cyclohexene-1-carboxylate synthase
VFFDEINNKVQDSLSDYSTIWKRKYVKANEIYQNYKQNIAFSDLLVFDFILKNMDDKSDLHIANSSPIRYQQLFENKRLNTMCNRGTSGIDGCSSTAVGYAIKNEKSTWLITGDVSFLYDSNAWWNTYKSDLNIILINNGGGGIFRIIPGPSNMEGFETYFETQNHIDISSICDAFKINYLQSNDLESLDKSLDQLKAMRGTNLLEIHTPIDENAKILNVFFDLLRAQNSIV